MKNLIFGLMLLVCSNAIADTPEVPTLAQLQDSIKQLSDNDVALEKRISELEKKCEDNACKCDVPKLGATATATEPKLTVAKINDKPVTKAEVDAEMEKPLTMRDLVSMAAGYSMAEQEQKAKTAYSTSSYASAPAPVSNVVRSASGGSTGNVAAPSGGSAGSIPLAPSYTASAVDLGSIPLAPGESIVPGSVRVTNGVSAPVPASSGQAVYCLDQFGNRVPCNQTSSQVIVQQPQQTGPKLKQGPLGRWYIDN